MPKAIVCLLENAMTEDPRLTRKKDCLLMQMTDPYLNLYRGLVPPLLGTIDFTPLLGFFILQYISGVLESGAAEDELDEWW